VEAILRWENANCSRTLNTGTDNYLLLTMSEKKFNDFLSQLKGKPESSKGVKG